MLKMDINDHPKDPFEAGPGAKNKPMVNKDNPKNPPVKMDNGKVQIVERASVRMERDPFEQVLIPLIMVFSAAFAAFLLWRNMKKVQKPR
jgi:hypothetical protein